MVTSAGFDRAEIDRHDRDFLNSQHRQELLRPEARGSKAE